MPPITPPGVITQEFHTRRDVRRGVIAGVAGNVLEWYDFALFGFFAQQIGAHFFPADNPTASLLAAFGTFAAGFVMRPLGGALFGWVGDKFGRKQALLSSVMWDFEPIISQAVADIAAGTYGTQNYFLDIANGGLFLLETPREALHFLFCLLYGVAGAFLELAEKRITASSHARDVVIGEILQDDLAD